MCNLEQKESSLVVCEDQVAFRLGLWLGFISETLYKEEADLDSYIPFLFSIKKLYLEDLLFSKKLFYSVLLQIGIPKNVPVFIKKLSYSNPIYKNMFCMYVNGIPSYFELQNGSLYEMPVLKIKDENSCRVYTYKIIGSLLTLIEEERRLDSSYNAAERIMSYSYEVTKWNEENKLSIMVTFPFLTSSAEGEQTCKKISSLLKELNMKEFSIDSFYKNMKVVLQDVSLEVLLINFFLKDGEEWKKTDAILVESGLIKNFRITKQEKTFELDGKGSCTIIIDDFMFIQGEDKNVSVPISTLKQNKNTNLADIFLLAEEAMKGVDDVIALRNTL